MMPTYAFTYGHISGTTHDNPADNLLRPELGADPADNAALRDMADDMKVGQMVRITPSTTADRTALVVERIR